MIAYSQRAVAFMDILGFSAAIERSRADDECLDQLVRAIHSLRSPYYDEYLSQMAIDARTWLGNTDERPPEPRATQFSDSIVISRPADGFPDLVLDVAQAVHVLISAGMICRGGIDVGALIHDSQILLGPAMIAAYSAEKTQPYPAVVVPVSLAHTVIMKEPSTSGPGPWTDPRKLQAARELLVPLSAEYYFVDYFNDYPRAIEYDDGSSHFWRLREVIVDGLRAAPCPRIHQKYAWMAERFNESGLVSNGTMDPVRFSRMS